MFDNEIDNKQKQKAKVGIKLGNVILIIIIVAIVTAYTTSFVIKNNSSYSNHSSAQLDAKQGEIINLLNSNYYTDIDVENLNEGALKGLVNGLEDPYSTYLSNEEYNQFTASIENEYVGIGVSIDNNGAYIFINEVFRGSPAEKAGLISGDVFKSIDGTDVEGVDSNQLVSLVRGEAGSEVVIEVYRGSFDNVLKYTVTRGVIELPDIEYALLDEKIAYIKLNTFSKTIFDEFSESYNELTKQGATKLIIDVRDNSGGYLDQVMKIIDVFVDDKKPIYQEEAKGKILNKTFGSKEKIDIDTVILINENSASASELLASAFNEINNSQLIGTKTFGKGVAQTQYKMSDGDVLKYTYAKWLTPDGNWINEVGIQPTHEVVINKELTYSFINITDDLMYDMVDLQVLNAQRILNLTKYKVREDSYYDNEMVEVVKKFQIDNGLDVTGNVDLATATKLNEVLKLYKSNYDNDVVIKKAVEVLNDE